EGDSSHRGGGAADLVGDDAVDAVEEAVDVGPPAAGGEVGQGVGEDERVTDRGDDAGGAGLVEHAEVPVATGRTPGLGVEYDVVVGQLDRAGPPARDGLGDGDLEL